MSWSAGRPSIRRLMARSLSGSALSAGNFVELAKLSVVETSNITRDGRSARAHTIPEDMSTSPDCRPWVKDGREAAFE